VNPRPRGTTLVELMVLLAVIGAMAGLSSYAFERMTRNSKQVATIREVFMLVQEARAEARARNQPVRIDVTPVTTTGTQEIRWGRLPCADAWGRTCPDTACTSATACGVGGCNCERQSDAVVMSSQVTLTNVAGTCFSGSSGQPRGSTCAGAARTVLRFDLADQPNPYLIVLESLTGSARLIDCARKPKDANCP
jgi:type II secretory pathway pseudopilin PulG